MKGFKSGRVPSKCLTMKVFGSLRLGRYPKPAVWNHRMGTPAKPVSRSMGKG